ncbi:hypothetical protein SLEP1_g24874 [Rubroshorea leprosula]|uniref:Uncharacterized protein n=1 Tax=Rubroshorea leprosula TaxID=152421 RepID=A0AAV5JUB9_9ROSI|nr:hypothetical protein SLEP1_g24874 [Rubroshorea leprosula]
MAEKNGREQLDDLETGNTEVGSSSMNAEITKESASTPTEPPPTPVNKENTIPNENSKAKGETEEDMGYCATAIISMICGCLRILLVILFVLLLPVYYLIKLVYVIVRAIWVIEAEKSSFRLVGLGSYSLACVGYMVWESGRYEIGGNQDDP